MQTNDLNFGYLFEIVFFAKIRMKFVQKSKVICPKMKIHFAKNENSFCKNEFHKGLGKYPHICISHICLFLVYKAKILGNLQKSEKNSCSTFLIFLEVPIDCQKEHTFKCAEHIR
jgi:hypothetical protein